MAARFYVYEILKDDGSVIYVGKGSGSRMATSKRHQGGSDAREVARFFNEIDAYQFEIEHIRAVRPINNKHPGGNGSYCGFHKRVNAQYVRPTKEEIYIHKIGGRVYAARMLIKFYATFKYLTSKVELTSKEKLLKSRYTPEIRQSLSSLDVDGLLEVGYGCRN